MVKLKSLLRWISTPNNNTLMTAASVTRLAEAQVTLLSLSRRQTLNDVFSNSNLESGDAASSSVGELNGSSSVVKSQIRRVETGDCVIRMPAEVEALHSEICAGFHAMIPYLRSIAYTTLMPQQCIRLLKSHQVFPWIPGAVIQAMANRMIAYKYMISVVALSQLIELLAAVGFRNATLQDEWMGRVAEGSPFTGFNNTAPVGPMSTPSDALAVLRCAGVLHSVTHSLSKAKFRDVLYHTVVKERRAFYESASAPAKGYCAATLYRDMAEEVFALSHTVGAPAIHAGGLLQHAVNSMPPERQAVARGLSEQYGRTPTTYFEALMTDFKNNGTNHRVGAHLDMLAGILQMLPTHDVAIPSVRFIAVYLTSVCKVNHKKALNNVSSSASSESEKTKSSSQLIVEDDWDKLMHIVKLLERPLFISHPHIAQAVLECTGYYMAEMHRSHADYKLAERTEMAAEQQQQQQQ